MTIIFSCTNSTLKESGNEVNNLDSEQAVVGRATTELVADNYAAMLYVDAKSDRKRT